MARSSLEGRVRALCQQVAAAKTQAELDILLPALQAAIRDHISYLRILAMETIAEAYGSKSNAAD
jgi:hypothetical protein